MAIQVNGTTVIDNSRNLNNISSIDATTAAAINAAGVGGGSAGELDGPLENYFFWENSFPSGHEVSPETFAFFIGTDTYISTYRSGDGGRRSLLKSTNYGQSWTEALNWQGTNDSAWTNNMYNAHFAWDGGNNAMFVIPDYYGGLFYTTNGGSSWSEHNPFGNSSYPNWVTSAGGGYFLCGVNDKIYRSSNNGASWSQIHSGLTFYSGEVQGNTMILTDSSNNLTRSTNFKTGWSYTNVSTNGVYAGRSNFTKTNGIWMNSEGKYSTNDGVTWNIPTNSPSGPNYSISGINGYFINRQYEYYAYTTNGQGWTWVFTGIGGSSSSEPRYTTVKPPNSDVTTYMSIRLLDNQSPAHISKLTIT